jgi:hypothetical protein
MSCEGQKGRSDDTTKISGNITDWLAEDDNHPLWPETAAPKYDKTMRGFNDRQIARLILPIQWLEEFDCGDDEAEQ